jgi:predicted RNase H-like nuclease
MAIVAGADGCRGGWVCIRKDLETATITADVHKTADTLFHQQPAPTVLAIDIPIGLCDDGPRQCDLAARQRLGRPRSSSVFPAPSRPLLKAESWEEAVRINKQRWGKSISKQAYAIFGKVREVDELLCRDPALRERVREVHPEVSFWAWNGGEAMRHKKKRAEGRDDRRALVDAHFGQAAFDDARRKFLVKDVATDDILDAFAALWTAERIAYGTAKTLPPEGNVRDAKGLRMDIVY